MIGASVKFVYSGADFLDFKTIVIIILGIVALVIISLLLDIVRKAIRGLDITVLGVLFLWLGYQTAGMNDVDVLSGLLLLVGGTLAVVGLLVFIMLKVYRHGRNKRLKEQMEQERLQAERLQKMREAEAKSKEEAKEGEM